MTQIKCVYRPLLEEYLHLRHGYLSEREKGQQIAAFAQKKAMDLKGVISGGYTVYTSVAGEPVLCRRYEIDRIVDFLYVDFFNGLERNILPKRCENCGTWFLLSGNYSDYCPDCRPTCARKSYAERVRNDPVWQTYNRAYKTHYARWTKGKMTAVEFEQWSRYAVELRDRAEAGKLPFAEYEQQIRR